MRLEEVYFRQIQQVKDIVAKEDGEGLKNLFSESPSSKAKKGVADMILQEYLMQNINDKNFVATLAQGYEDPHDFWIAARRFPESGKDEAGFSFVQGWMDHYPDVARKNEQVIKWVADSFGMQSSWKEKILKQFEGIKSKPIQGPQGSFAQGGREKKGPKVQ